MRENASIWVWCSKSVSLKPGTLVGQMLMDGSLMSRVCGSNFASYAQLKASHRSVTVRIDF